MVDRRNTPLEDLVKSQLQSEEFTDHRSSHFGKNLYLKVTLPYSENSGYVKKLDIHLGSHVYSKQLFPCFVMSQELNYKNIVICLL